MGGFEQACGSHRLGYTWHLAINNRKSGIRRYILWADPGTAGRNHQIQTKFVGKVAKSLFNEVLIIWKHLEMSYEKSSFVQNLLHCWTAAILALTPETPIADCQYCRPSHIHHYTKAEISLSLGALSRYKTLGSRAQNGRHALVLGQSFEIGDHQISDDLKTNW